MSIRHNFTNDLAIYTIVVLKSVLSPPLFSRPTKLTLHPSGSSILGRILPAYLADHFGHFNSISIISLLNAILLLAFWLPLEISSATTHLQVFALSALAGFATGACISVFMPCVAELGPLETLGARFGMYQLVIGVGCVSLFKTNKIRAFE